MDSSPSLLHDLSIRHGPWSRASCSSSPSLTALASTSAAYLATSSTNPTSIHSGHNGQLRSIAGSTGTAFTLGLQSGIAQLGGVVGPQLFQSKQAHNGYKTNFAIAAAFTIAGWVSNLWTWWLTRKTEYDVMRVRRLVANQAKKDGRVSAGDINIFEERQFYDRDLKKTNGAEGDSASEVIIELWVPVCAKSGINRPTSRLQIDRSSY